MNLGLPVNLAKHILDTPYLKIETRKTPVIRRGTESYPLALLNAPSKDASGLEWLISQGRKEAKQNRIPILITSFLAETWRRSLEENKISYIDYQGYVHLVGPSWLLHWEKRQTKIKNAERGVGVDTIRTIQTLFEDFTQPWSITSLAQRADISVGQAHRVFELLEKNILLTTQGTGPAKRRYISNGGELLSWLSQQVAAKRQAKKIEVALYGRTFEELMTKISKELQTKKIAHAVTGNAAATLYNAGATTFPKSLIRISPERDLEEIADILKAEITDRGANIILIQDTGRVGTWQAHPINNIFLAPKIRIYLDCLTEQRGEDIAKYFREVVLGF